MDKETDPLIRKTVSLPRSTWREVEEYRRGERAATESEVIRRLILEALRAYAKATRK